MASHRYAFIALCIAAVFIIFSENFLLSAPLASNSIVRLVSGQNYLSNTKELIPVEDVCSIKMTVNCTLASNGTDCAKVVVQPSSCYVRVNYTFRACNMATKTSVNIIHYKAHIIHDDVSGEGFNGTLLPGGSCQMIQSDHSLNTCDIKADFGSLHVVGITQGGMFCGNTIFHWANGLESFTNQPSTRPTRQPSSKPSKNPVTKATGKPIAKPTTHPSVKPTLRPSAKPTEMATGPPTAKPTARPHVGIVKPMQVLPSYNYEFPYNKTCEFEYLAAPRFNTTHKYHISLYYHVGMVKNWLNVLYDQLDTLERCGLGYLAKELTISVNTEAPKSAYDDLSLILKKYSFAQYLQSIRYLRSEYPRTYEWSIMQEMRNDCIQQENSTIKRIVFYFHTKGVSRFNASWTPDGDNEYFNVLSWRKYMEFFLMERPTLCLRALLYHGAGACGVNIACCPKHYQGNFWAVTCDRITHLNNTQPGGLSSLFTHVWAELWIGNQSSTVNTTQVLELMKAPAFYNQRTHPQIYQQMITNRSLWRDSLVPIWQDYLYGLSFINKTSM